ncbi:hypothetical protein ONE63_007161 [Megalurothrips usitatus]|uniref:PARP n=1 Tax=Megalurothrips usitatus TaxID=439358 RepID=A0AAV7XRX2_9NEOP|nr:hypothetical protein ONE63_007161 [Megalurothrips usitatus]
MSKNNYADKVQVEDSRIGASTVKERKVCIIPFVYRVSRNAVQEEPDQRTSTCDTTTITMQGAGAGLEEQLRDLQGPRTYDADVDLSGYQQRGWSEVDVEGRSCPLLVAVHDDDGVRADLESGGLRPTNIVQIYRVQAPELARWFEDKATEYEQAYGRPPGRKRLMHGTAADNIPSIVQTNLLKAKI